MASCPARGRNLKRCLSRTVVTGTLLCRSAEPAHSMEAHERPQGKRAPPTIRARPLTHTLLARQGESHPEDSTGEATRLHQTRRFRAQAWTEQEQRKEQPHGETLGPGKPPDPLPGSKAQKRRHTNSKPDSPPGTEPPPSAPNPQAPTPRAQPQNAPRPAEHATRPEPPTRHPAPPTREPKARKEHESARPAGHTPPTRSTPPSKQRDGPKTPAQA